MSRVRSSPTGMKPRPVKRKPPVRMSSCIDARNSSCVIGSRSLASRLRTAATLGRFGLAGFTAGGAGRRGRTRRDGGNGFGRGVGKAEHLFEPVQ